MQVYLPIAEIPVNVFLILSLGLVTGFLAGMFGIGGGFLATPFLMFIGIPPAIAVSTASNQIVAASVSGLLAHLKRGNVDIKMGIFLLIGGLIGSTFGVVIFNILHKAGHIDLVVGITYIIFLGSIGILMFVESVKKIMSKNYRISFDEEIKESKSKILENFLVKLEKLPYKVYFPKSDITVSAIIPITLSIGIGFLVALMGIGGGFLMIPAMLYILNMPSHIVVGTSLFQIIFTASNTTFLQALTNHTVDIVLALLMVISSAIGAQIGTKSGHRADPDKMRSILSLLIIGTGVKMFLDLFTKPESLFVIELMK